MRINPEFFNMAKPIIETLESLENLSLDLDSEYYSDFAAAALGRAEALRAHLLQLGFYDLVEQFDRVGMDQGNLITALEFVRNFVGPEVRRRLQEIEQGSYLADLLWDQIHPRIRSVAKPRFKAGHFADAVESALKEVNSVVKAYVRDRTGKELDGTELMNMAFSKNNPVIRLAETNTETGKNIQQGYMQIFAGAIMAIRNPKAHENISISRERAIHFLYLASLLMGKYDERLENGATVETGGGSARNFDATKHAK